MIHIDIYVPAIGDSFEFRCDENVPVYCICKDIYEILVRKSGESADEEALSCAPFWLCDADRHNILSMEKSLHEENIMNGGKMIFL